VLDRSSRTVQLGRKNIAGKISAVIDSASAAAARGRRLAER
jgi:hypothetical protein